MTNLEISPGSSIPNRPTAMIFSATSKCDGIGAIYQTQRPQGVRKPSQDVQFLPTRT
jgi:hypothetical protein